MAIISTIYKKWAVDQCENYRPISLLNLGYKIFASLVQRRLVQAGAEDRLSSSQFGFRSNSSMQDAIFTLRRKVDAAWATRHGKLVVLALDWQKAFDAINIEAMIVALGRFGLPDHVFRVISAIYSKREFQVKDCGQISEKKLQRSGISQGCPLSPFLFVMLMTVLMDDATQSLEQHDRELMKQGLLAELLYADDTLLLGVSAASVERFLKTVSDARARYGLEMHWGKLQLMQVRSDRVVHRPDGSSIEAKIELGYLGTNVAEDGRCNRELGRRLGFAHCDFRNLNRIWRHSALTRRRNIEFFNALIRSRLLYSMSTVCFNKAERRRLDGFQNRCLRVIWGIKASFISRVSNMEVLSRTGQRLFSDVLLEQQLLLYGRAARSADYSPMRTCVFCPGLLQPVTEALVRRVGRPRSEWAHYCQGHAARIQPNYVKLKESILDPDS